MRTFCNKQSGEFRKEFLEDSRNYCNNPGENLLKLKKKASWRAFGRDCDGIQDGTALGISEDTPGRIPDGASEGIQNLLPEEFY